MEQSLQRNSPTETLAYLAGYFEGEGTISFNRDRGKPPLLTVRVATGDKIILEEFAQTFGGEVRKKKTAALAKRQMWYWGCTGNKAQEVLRQLMPYFRFKKELAFLALVPVFGSVGTNAISLIERELRERIADQISAINQRVTVC
jgi:hypothetical protein